MLLAQYKGNLQIGGTPLTIDQQGMLKGSWLGNTSVATVQSKKLMSLVCCNNSATSALSPVVCHIASGLHIALWASHC